MTHRSAAQPSVTRGASLAEIERTLHRYGAAAFLYGWHAELAVIGVRRTSLPISCACPCPTCRGVHESGAGPHEHRRSVVDAPRGSFA